MGRHHLGLKGAIIVFIILAHTNCLFAAAGEAFTVSGYYFDISADRLGGALSVRGSISGGDSCKKLVADIYLRSEEGARKRVVAIINDYGGNARFDLKEPNIGKGRRWKVSKVKVRTYK